MLPEETFRDKSGAEITIKPINHLDDAASVLCYREVHVGHRTRSPHWLRAQQVLPGTFDQLLVLDAHSSQHHPLRTVVVTQVAVKHRLVNLVHVVYGTKARQSDRVASICGLEINNEQLQ